MTPDEGLIASSVPSFALGSSVARRSVADHADKVAHLLQPLGAEDCSIGEASGRVLATSLVAAHSVPPFISSAMDGYAVRRGDLTGSETVLAVSLEIPAGTSLPGPLPPGTAARIMTGAPVPDGTDLIVKVEDTDASVGTVRVRTSISSTATNIKAIGSEVQFGDLLISAGTRLAAPHIALAGAMGRVSLSVVRKMRVAIVSTGDELNRRGEDLDFGKIFETNALMLAASVQALGAEVAEVLHVPDDITRFREVLRSLPVVDLVITSGGISVGAYEVVKTALADDGVEFVQVAMRPGRPQGAGHAATSGGGVTPLVALPGNPTATLASFHLFVAPAIARAMGAAAATSVYYLPIAAPLVSRKGTRDIVQACISRDGTTVMPMMRGRGIGAWGAERPALIDIPEGSESIPIGTPVRVTSLA